MCIRFICINLSLIIMPKYYLLTLFIWFLPLTTAASSGYSHGIAFSDSLGTHFTDALVLYRQHNYGDALELFEQIDQPLAMLFAAKSAYGLGNYIKTVDLARSAAYGSPNIIADEADFVKSMAFYQLRNYHESLLGFYTLCRESNVAELADKACAQFEDVVSYLSFYQRLQALDDSRLPEIRRSLTEPSILQRYSENQITQLIDTANLPDIIAVDTLSSSEIDSLSSKDFGSIPKGTIFTIGVLLPGFNEDPGNKPVSRGLYAGILMAADEFNRQNPDHKARIVFKDSDMNPNNPGSLVSDLINIDMVDVIVGPLYSEQVRQLAPLVNRQRTSLFAPLANTINLSDDLSYVYQINPSFEARGRQFARYLVNQLGKKRIGVITEQGSFGETEAEAFRQEAEILGAEVPLFFSEDFAANGYSVSHILPWFANSDELIEDTLSYRADSLDAVFVSFTSDLGETLLDLTLTGLEAFQPDYTVLTNETLSYMDHSVQRIRTLDMIYADTYYLQESSEEVINFRYDYRNRVGYDPTMFSYVGYDIGAFILNAINRLKNPDNFNDFLREMDVFEGIATRINFEESTMNQSLQFFKMTTNGVENVTELVIEIPADSLNIVDPEFDTEEF